MGIGIDDHDELFLLKKSLKKIAEQNGDYEIDAKELIVILDLAQLGLWAKNKALNVLKEKAATEVSDTTFEAWFYAPAKVALLQLNQLNEVYGFMDKQE